MKLNLKTEIQYRMESLKLSYKENKKRVLITAGVAALVLLVSFSAFGSSTNYQAQAQATADIQKSISAVEVAKQETERARLIALAALSSKFNGDQALAAFITETLASKLGTGGLGSSSASQPQVQLAQAPQELPECGFGCYMGKAFAGTLGIVERLAPVALGAYQTRSNLIANTTQALYNRDIQINSQNTNASMFNSAGATNASIANSGFQSGSGIATAFAQRPSVVVNNSGDNAAVAMFGSTATVNAPITTTVTCPNSNTGTSTSGNTTAGTAGSAAGSTGGAGAPTGAPTTNPTLSSNCTGK